MTTNSPQPVPPRSNPSETVNQDLDTFAGQHTPGPSNQSPASTGLGAAELIGHYEILGELGSGGMGVVLRARDPILKRPVAIKVLRAPGFDGEEQRARFELEARSTARLHHPSIVGIHEVGQHENQPYLVMDLIEGESLQAILTRAPLPPRKAAEIAQAIAGGLTHAHANGIIHRDMKPHNIIVDNEERPFLTDFGLALDTTLRQQLTATGELVGTPAYMAPEQADSEWGVIGETTDVYGLGVVLYSSLTGQQPHTALTAMGLLRKVLFEEVTPPRQVNPAIHPDLETITLRCMEKLPHERYGTAAEVEAELKRFLKGEAIIARPLTQPQRLLRWARRHQALSVTLTLLMAALLTIALTLVKQQRDMILHEQAVLQQERLRTLANARTAADEASRLFQANLVAPLSVTGSENDEPISQGLAALEANLRLLELLPADSSIEAAQEHANITEKSAMTALSLSRLARASRQWAVAQNALERAQPLGARSQELASAQTALVQARSQLDRERREAVQAVLSAARAGDLTREQQQRTASNFRGDYEEALLRLVGLDHPDTTTMLCDALDGVTQQLLQTSGQVFQDAIEKHDTSASQEALLAAARTWLADPRSIQSGNETDRLAKLAQNMVLLENERTIQVFGRFKTKGWEYDISFPLRNRQSATLSIGDTQLAQLCCDTLGYLSESDTAMASLTDYLQAEWSDTRGVHAAKALLRQRGKDALVILRHALTRLEQGDQIRRLLKTHRGAKNDVRTPESLIREAIESALKNDYDRAHQIAETALARKPDDPEALMIRGLVRVLRNQPEGPQDLERASQQKPGSPVIKICNAIYLFEQGRAHAYYGRGSQAEACWSTALQLTNEIMKTQDQHLPSRILRGKISFEREHYPHAAEAFSHALVADPNNVAALSGRALANKRMRKFHSAHRDYSLALVIDPENHVLWWSRGNVRVETGNFEGAIADHSEAIRLEPDFVLAWINRGNAYYTGAQLNEALTNLNHALELDPSQSTARLTRAQITMDMADKDSDAAAARKLRQKALEDLQRGMELPPLNSTFLFYLAECHFDMEQYPEAKAAALKFLELEPEGWLTKSTHELLTKIEARTGRSLRD